MTGKSPAARIFHSSRRWTYRRLYASMPHGMPASGTRDSAVVTPGDNQRMAAEVRQSPERSVLCPVTLDQQGDGRKRIPVAEGTPEQSKGPMIWTPSVSHSQVFPTRVSRTCRITDRKRRGNRGDAANRGRLIRSNEVEKLNPACGRGKFDGSFGW